MIVGVHAIVFSSQADELRRFFGEVLGLDSVDAGSGWPIYALPPAELAVHPDEGEDRHELYLMCEDLAAVRAELRAKGVQVDEAVAEQSWGRLTWISLPGGSRLALYEPAHPTAIGR